VYLSVHVSVSCLERRLLQILSVSQQEPGHESWNDEEIDKQGISSVGLETLEIRRLLDQLLHLVSNG
jgi:hypothetical protein